MKNIAFALVLLFVPCVSQADQLYAVNGSLTIVGNDVCLGPCIEIVNFSFDFREQADQNGIYYLSIVPGTSSVVSFGPLGTFSAPTGPYNPFPSGNPRTNYIEFRSSPSPAIFLEIDIWASQNGLREPFVPQIGGADLWACGTQDCLTDFCVPGETFVQCPSTQSAPVYDMFTPGTVESFVDRFRLQSLARSHFSALPSRRSFFCKSDRSVAT
jgi:hypothetical protein